ncbi:MAG: Rv2578c family radical SAM protein [Candidatus Velthaea sp.]
MQVVRRFSGVEVVEVEAKSILNPVTGMPFPWSINPYQGCFHQCVFCYARATHRYRELDGVTAWGSQIFAKVNAVELVRSELRRHRRTIGEVAIGTATDPYQSVEGRYRITRGILRELSLARTPMHLITRSGLVVRDLDILTEYAARAPISVCISLPTLDERLARELEPTVAPPAKRLVAVRRLAVAGVRVGVAIAPVIPGLTDAPEAIADVVRAAADAGASFAWHGVLNLGEVTRDAFFAYLDERHPDLVARYRAMYATRYPPRDYVRRIGTHVARARASIVFAPPEAIWGPLPPQALTLF